MGTHLTVVRADRELQCPRIDAELRARGVDLVLTPSDTPESTFVEAVRDADAILTCYQPITAQVVDAAVRLKGVIKYGVGVDAIDLEATRRRGIPVANVPDYAQETVAEAAFALMIALVKKLVPIQRATRETGWLWPEARWLSADVGGLTVGIVGVGHIGRCMARMCGRGFGTTVLGFDPFVSRDAMGALGVERRNSLREMLGECDVVSVHAALMPETRHLIGRDELGCMRSSAVLINVARGELVDEDALVDALQSGQIAGAGLDTYGQEPLTVRDHRLSPLFEMENVILLPHLAFYTAQAMERLERETLERCSEVLSGRAVRVRSDDPRLTAQTKGVVFDA